MREGKRESNCCRTPHSILKQHKNIPGVEMFVLKIQSCRGPFLPLIKVKRSTKYRWPPTCLRWTYPLPCWTLTEPPEQNHACHVPTLQRRENKCVAFVSMATIHLVKFFHQNLHLQQCVSLSNTFSAFIFLSFSFSLLFLIRALSMSHCLSLSYPIFLSPIHSSFPPPFHIIVLPPSLPSR